MTFLRILHLTCVATYAGLAGYVVWRAPGLRRSAGFALIAGCFAWWSASLVLAHDPAAPLAVARAAYDLGAVAWASFAPCCLLFALAFASRRLRRRWHAVALVAPAIGFMILQWRGSLADGYVHQAWGWGYRWSSSPWTFLYYGYYATLVGLALLVVLDFRRRTTDRLARRQATIIVATALVPLTLSTATDVVLPWLGVRSIPNIAPAFLLAWVAGIALAIGRFRLLEISPETAAGEIVTAMADGVLLVDLDGVVVRGNPAATELLAPRVGELRGARLDDLIAPPERAEGMLALGDRVISLGVSAVHDRHGTAIGSICLLRDVTARERIAAALRESRDELETRVRERTRELDVANQQLRRFSRALEGLLAATDAIHKGGTPAEVAATVAAAVPTGIAPRAVTACRVTIDGAVHPPGELPVPEAIVRVEVRSHAAKRGVIEVHLAAGFALHEEELRMLEAVATELGQSIDAVALRHQLAQSERLAAMGLLAAGVAHEINNPLAYVIAAVEELDRDLAAPAHEREAMRARAGEALDGARRIARIVSELGSFARADDEHLAIDIAAPIDGAIAMARNQLRHRGRLVVDHGGSAIVEADPGRLTQVVLNLLINALHALPETGGEVGVRSWVEGDEVFVEVRDNGVGIPPEDVPRLFEPFFSRKRSGKGSGLGLAISHGIVTAAGGRIAVESQIGVGTRFTIALPRSTATVAPTASPAPASPAPAPRPVVAPTAPMPMSAGAPPRARILLVDDDPLVGRALRRMLRDHDCVVADSIEAAKRQLEAEPFDVLISDIMMPEATGADLLAWIEVEMPEYADRILFMTGGAFTPAADELAGRMGDRIIKKPFELDEVTRLVARCLELSPARRA